MITEFILFIAAAVTVYYLSPSKIKWMVLLTASIIFYANLNAECIPIFATTMVLTFCTALAIEKFPKYKKHTVSICLLLTAGIWYYYKILGILFCSLDLFAGKWMVPVGISYYTLQSAGYLFDVYHGQKAERNILKYSLFLLWFPGIIQGPISRYSELMPKLEANHKFDYNTMVSDLLLILFGGIKKFVIADVAASYVNYVFPLSDNLHGLVLYIGILAYSLQIYMDFSGCVDICRGVSALFGVYLRPNFNTPYFSRSIKEFWRRWHITFSTWMRDYLYIPLGGNRRGTGRKYVNILLVFLFSAFWHGGSLTFLVWGMLHAAYQIIGEYTEKNRERVKEKLHIHGGTALEAVIQVVITFHLVAFAWIFFRASNMSQAFYYIINMFRITGAGNSFSQILGIIGFNEIQLLAIMINTVIVLYVDYRHYHHSSGIRKSIQSKNIVIRWMIYYALIYDFILFGEYGESVAQSAFLYGGF